MGTRSTVAIVYKNGTVQAHYNNWDGDLAGVGQVLYEHYRNIQKVKELIQLGDTSYIAKELYPSENSQHNFIKNQKDVTLFYGRDRRDDNCEPSSYDSLNHYLEKGRFEGYDYIFKEKNKTWYIINNENKKLHFLSSKLFKDDKVKPHIKEMIFREKEAKRLDKELPHKEGMKSKFKI